MNNKTIYRLITLANQLDSLGLEKEADAVNNIIKTAGFKDKLRNIMLGLGLLTLPGTKGEQGPPPPPPTRIEADQPREVVEYIVHKVSAGETGGQIAKKYLPSLDSQTATRIVEEYNKEKGIDLDLGKIKKDQEIHIPTIEYLQSLGYEERLGTGLEDTHSVFSPSSDIIEFIRQAEGKSSKVYDSRVGKNDLTIGIGHKLTDAEKELVEKLLAKKVSSIKINGVTLSLRNGELSISPQQAEAIYQVDIEKTKATLDRLDLRPEHLTQNEYDAIFSLAFNTGSVPKKIRQAIFKRNKEVIPQLMLGIAAADGQHQLGLERRRMAEANIWNESSYIAPHNFEPN